jgi:hypothetical protein
MSNVSDPTSLPSPVTDPSVSQVTSVTSTTTITAPPVPLQVDIVPDRPKASWIWLKDSSGYPSVTVTMLTVSFWVTTIVYIISQIQSIGPVTFRGFDVGACGAYFGAILALYFGRRFTDAKYNLINR